MKIPLKYTIRNFSARKLTTGITLMGISLVVFVFAAVLMMAFGIQKTLRATGLEENVIVTRKAANGEISSLIEGEVQNIIRSMNYIKRNEAGLPLITTEPVVIININKKDGGLSNVTVRGVSPQINEVRPQAEIVDGRMFTFGVNELIVGSSIEKRFVGASIGDMVKFAGDEWKIVGKFTTDGSGFDSEMWGDSERMLNAFNRGSTVSSITFRLDDPANFDAFKREFESDRRLTQYEPKIEQVYFEEQSEMMAVFIRVLGIFITIIFSFGSIIGAMITMYSAVANRTVEIGTMRALGFKRRSILTAFLIESLGIALIGGVIGLLLASALQFFSISTLNFGSFSELEFSFALNSDIVISSLIFALAMGFLGGFLPSVRASRLNIVSSLRSA